MTTYLVQTTRNGEPWGHFFYDDEDSARQAAAALLFPNHECDRVTRRRYKRLWRKGRYRQAVRMWNSGRFTYQAHVFKITVDSPSESFMRLLETAFHYDRKK
ncbi:hypothetical protein LCGC14_2180780 [marine sediment metagenome]|uniref:Uncharacterized protein n=1 Tax=marine sediment metagenome TaxID=412755 RepID=A0A0F9DMH7_9ZZZZ